VHRRLVLLGPPAAGKGTQAELLKDRFGFDAPSVGAMLREQKAAGAPAGLRAAEYFERGLLVPDEITIEVVRQWLAGHRGAWALDGYPRTVRQAEAFDTMLRDQHSAVDLAILLVADEAVIRDRVAHRLVCRACGGVFRAGQHVAGPADPCPRCRGVLGRRADDNVEALTDRLAEYRAKTEPVISYYQTRGLLRTIDGNREVETVFADFSAALDGAPTPGAPAR
jgi:adenylate kinase